MNTTTRQRLSAIINGDQWVDGKGAVRQLRDMDYLHLMNLRPWLVRNSATLFGQYVTMLTQQRADAERDGTIGVASAYGQLLAETIERGPQAFILNSQLLANIDREIEHRHQLALRKGRLERKSVAHKKPELTVKIDASSVQQGLDWDDLIELDCGDSAQFTYQLQYI